jgi:hypothetical protein
VLQLGQYGVHFVPPPPDVELLKPRAEDPATLARILARTAFPGLVLLDTKSDLEALTRNALRAADLAILPVADRASLEEAGKAMELLARRRGARAPASCRRWSTAAPGWTTPGATSERLMAAIDARGWPRFETYLSRSPRVEALNSASSNPGSILHHARGTQVYTPSSGARRRGGSADRSRAWRDGVAGARLDAGAPPEPETSCCAVCAR